jgi:ribulose 1,5-bisphosphate carboxylase large subunit-like protein
MINMSKKIKIFRRINDIDREKYILCRYFLSSNKSLKDAAWGLSIGQSVGNPNVRNHWETDELFENHSCFVIGDEEDLKTRREGEVTIAFPIVNTDFKSDGISHLLCQFMGGQIDIDSITKCHLLKVDFPKHIENSYFMKPKYGIDGIRDFTGAHDKPLFGGIVKPKIGVNSDILLEMVKEMVEGGINFIKEDEIMANPACCPIEERVPKIMEYLKGKNVVYAVCINCDPHHVIDRVKKVYELGANAIHINFWSGLGVYKSIRELDLPIFIHFQKSGDKVLTNKSHDYHISWDVICDLAGLMGVDFIHAGMWGGYMSDSEGELNNTLNILHNRNVMPALSCGMHAGLIEATNKRFGLNYMANIGGAIHGHPNGSKSGAIAIRQSIDKNYGNEYYTAIEKWGLVE